MDVTIHFATFLSCVNTASTIPGRSSITIMGSESLQFLSSMVLRGVLSKTVLVEEAKQISVVRAKREAGYDNVDEDDDLDILRWFKII